MSKFPVTNFGKNKYVCTDSQGRIITKNFSYPYGEYDDTETYTEAELKEILSKQLVCATFTSAGSLLLFCPAIGSTFIGTDVFGGAKGYKVAAGSEEGTYVLTANS